MSSTRIGSVRPSQDQRAQRTDHGGHHRRHGFRELHPDGILRLHAAVAGQDGAAGAHDFRQVLVGFPHGRVAEELRDGSQGRGRARIEEGGAGGGVAVAAVLLGQHAVDGQEIAQDADAAVGRRAVAGDERNVARALRPRPEEVEIDRGLQGGGALMRLQHVEDHSGSQRGFRAISWVHNILLFDSPGYGFAFPGNSDYNVQLLFSSVQRTGSTLHLSFGIK